MESIFLSIGVILLIATVICVPVGLILVVIGVVSNRPKTTGIGLRVLLGAGIALVLSAALCSAFNFFI